MLDTETEENEKNIQNAKTWSNYVDRLTNPLISGELRALNQTSGPSIRSKITSGNNESTLPIKEEKLDEEAVSGCKQKAFTAENGIVFKVV